MKDLEKDFLDEIIKQSISIPPTIYNGIADYLITCGIRWWRNWNKTGLSQKPSTKEIERGTKNNGDPKYEFHAMMVHLSLNKNHQEKIRRIIEKSWPYVMEQLENFDPDNDDDNLFSERWRLQNERTRYFRDKNYLPWNEIGYFVKKCVEITTKPIFNHRNNAPYSYYENNDWIYLLNSSDEGMELNYSEKLIGRSERKNH